MVTDIAEIEKILQEDNFVEYEINEADIEKKVSERLNIIAGSVAMYSYTDTTCCISGCGTSTVSLGCQPPA